MPELPEVETMAAGAAKKIVGCKISQIFPLCVKLRKKLPNFSGLAGLQVLRVRRLAKYMLVECEQDVVLLVHFGMTGSLRFADLQQAFAYQKNDRVVFVFESLVMFFHDPRKFGMVEVITKKDLSSPAYAFLFVKDPLDPDLSVSSLFDKIKKLGCSIKEFLLSQKYLTGVGNIYACEALFLARINPLTPVCLVSEASFELLLAKLQILLAHAIELGGSSIKDYRSVEGVAGSFQQKFKVYGRANQLCLQDGCVGIICRIKQGGRSTFYCAQCQGC